MSDCWKNDFGIKRLTIIQKMVQNDNTIKQENTHPGYKRTSGALKVLHYCVQVAIL